MLEKLWKESIRLIKILKIAKALSSTGTKVVYTYFDTLSSP